MEGAQDAINDVRDETSKTILELATNADSLWNLMSAPEKRVFLSKLLSNQVLDGVNVRYELIKPLRTLSEMTSDSNWRREWDSNPRAPRRAASFQDWCFQPLNHLSVDRSTKNYALDQSLFKDSDRIIKRDAFGRRLKM